MELRARQTAADFLEQEAASYLGVNRTGARALEVLLRAGSLTAGELAELLGLSASGTTPMLDGLERVGAIRRVRKTKGDRRRIHLELTTKGRSLSQRVWGDLYAPLAELAEELTRAEQLLVLDFLRRANAVLGGARSGSNPRAPSLVESEVDAPMRDPEPPAEAPAPELYTRRTPARRAPSGEVPG